VFPRPLNGAQLAKLCGHFKLKSKVGGVQGQHAWLAWAWRGVLRAC
jgi:hypothetical protein